MIVCDDFSHYTLVLFLKHKSDAARPFEYFTTSVSGHNQVRESDNDWFLAAEVVAAGTQGIASKSAKIQAPFLFHGGGIPIRDDPCTEGASWATDSINLSTKTVKKPDCASPYET